MKSESVSYQDHSLHGYLARLSTAELVFLQQSFESQNQQILLKAITDVLEKRRNNT